MIYTDYVTNKTVSTSQPFPHISKETKTSTKNQNVWACNDPTQLVLGLDIFFCIFDHFMDSEANLWLSGEDIDLIIYILQ